MIYLIFQLEALLREPNLSFHKVEYLEMYYHNILIKVMSDGSL